MRDLELVRDEVVRLYPQPTPEPEPESEIFEEEVPLEVLLEIQAFEAEMERLDDGVVEEPQPLTWFDIWNAEGEQVEGVLMAARAQADDVRRRAHGEGELAGYAEGYTDGLARGRAQGYAEGHAEGREIGHSEAIAEAAGTLNVATQVAGSTRIERRELLEAVDEGLVNLTIAVARRVIQTELSIDPTFVSQCVQTALRAVADSPMAMLHINPEDAEILQETWGELKERFGDGGLQLVPDARIPRGGCIVDAESRTVDAQIESKLEEIQRQFLRMTEPRV
jgi:flagellar assembly protein FliH